jgi:hypothetical protein
MALPTSSLSQVCRAIADFVSDGLQASANSIRVLIGNPAEAVPGQADTEHRVNLFFYRLEPPNFYPDTSPGDSWWLRLNCLITAFGVAEDQVSSGENDLRLVGELMRLFHETPVLKALRVGDEEFRLQVVFQPLSVDDLNHIWSTQNDVSYRPSVAYEMALAPVIPMKRSVGSPLVGAVGAEVRGDVVGRMLPFAGQILAPPVLVSMVDTSFEGWAPSICFIYEGKCALSLAFEKGSEALANFQPEVWVAGEPGATVTLTWEEWTREKGWQEVHETKETTATTRLIDPDRVETAVTEEVELPGKGTSGQAVLYAKRRYVRAVDGQELIVLSNPLLVSIYEGS